MLRSILKCQRYSSTNIFFAKLTPRIFRENLKTHQITDLRQFSKMARANLDDVPLVEIEEGIFKYILIKASCKDTNGKELSKEIVRGYISCHWHSDILERVENEFKSHGFNFKCLGGGRIEHNPRKKQIKVYGYSQGFGKADHSVSEAILKTKYEDYEYEISDEGY